MLVRTAVLASLYSVSAAALAQQQLEEVVVTAQKHAEAINDVGMTITALTGESLKDMGVFTARDIALHTPGLTVNETAALGVPVYTIRGVGFQDYNIGSSSTVGLYFDEVSLPYAVMTRGVTFDLERVEVLKGPQGDLYGRNTTAGSINFVHRKPTEDFEAGVTASYGSYQTFDLEGHVSGPLGESVQGRIAFRTTQAGEGWQKSLTRPDDKLGEQDIFAVRGLLNVEFGESATLLLNAHYMQDRSDNIAGTTIDGRIIGLDEAQAPYTALGPYRLPGGEHLGETPPWYTNGKNDWADWTNTGTTLRNGLPEAVDLRPQRDNELQGVSARLDWDLGAVTLTSITAYDEFRRHEIFEGDGGAFNDSGNINTSELEVFSEELRLSGKTDRLLWIAGLFYSSDKVDEWYNYFMRDSIYGLGSVVYANSGDPRAALFSNAPILELDTRYNQDTTSKAVFGHLEYSLTDKSRLTLGLRYTDEERDWEGCTYDVGDGTLTGFLNFAFGTTLTPGSCGTVDDIASSPLNYVNLLMTGQDPNLAFHPYTDTVEARKWQWKVGYDYKFTDDVLGYLTISTGFKSGGFNGANSNAQTQLVPYQAEQLTAYEAGIKATLLDGSMQFNAAAFYYDYEDKQEQDLAVTLVGNISGLTNVPKSKIVGAEAELRWLPVQGLNIDLSVAWLDTEIKEWMAVNPDPELTYWTPLGPVISYVDASGGELAMSPHWQYNATVDYRWSVGGEMTMSVGGDLSHKDETTAQLREQALEAYTVLNARVALGSDDDKWRVTLWSYNVTDRDYFVAAYVGNGPYSRVMAMPRTYGLTLDYRFQ